MALEPLGSDHFFELMSRLKEAGANELYAIKAESWMDKASRLLEIEPTEVTIGYADKVTDPVEQLNFSMVAKVQSGVAQQIVDAYTSDLKTLPGVSKDKDYCTLTDNLMRSAHMFKEVNTHLYGMAPTWERFFESRRKPVFETFAEMVDDSNPRRKLLFEALSSIVTGRVTPELEEYREDLEQASEQFYAGQSEELADMLYGITAQILDMQEPEPGGGDGDDEDDSDKDFGELGEFLQQTSDTSTPEDLGASEATKTPLPEGLDLDKARDLQEMEADVVFPEADNKNGYITFTVPKPAYAEQAYAANLRVLSTQIMRLRQIIEEYYRTNTITETGLKSGRVDAGRVHRLNYGTTNVFKRHTVDAVGHADVIILLDESGSMSMRMNSSGIKEANLGGIPGSAISTRYGSDKEPFLGKAIVSPDSSRTAVGMRMALMLLEVSRQLSGFHVQVAGYSQVSGHVLGPMKELAKATKAGSKYYSDGASVVRVLGSTENPYPIVTALPMQENADYPAMDWAIKQLKKSNANQRAILYLADGEIWETGKDFEKAMQDAQKSGITTFFMNLAMTPPRPDSMLGKVPRQDVQNFDDMVKGLKTFLNMLVAQIA